ncbi:MAG TPA: VOC family protein [Acidimicrobiales bacterium]|nr:VOC family protein [Acidimicrobiales bacterium]
MASTIWRLITGDMDTTVRFYHGVLGARLVATIGTPDFRHYFFEIGPGQTVAFFEYTSARPASFAKPAGVPDRRAIQFDHLSLDLADEAGLESLQARLKAYGCEVTDVIDHGFVRSIYFSDPNGIALEASWWVRDATAGDVDYADAMLFSDPDPVPSVPELMESGDVSSTPATRLVHEPSEVADPV